MFTCLYASSNIYEQISLKCFGGTGRGQRNIRLDFGGDTAPIPLLCPNFPLPQCIFNGIAIVYDYIRQVAALVLAEVMGRTVRCVYIVFSYSTVALVLPISTVVSGVV